MLKNKECRKTRISTRGASKSRSPACGKDHKNLKTVPSEQLEDVRAFSFLALGETSRRRGPALSRVTDDRSLVTSAGPNFVLWARSPTIGDQLRIGATPNITDADGRKLQISRTAPLLMRISNYAVKIDFLVCGRLAASFVLGYSFSEKFMEPIGLRRRCVELDDGSTVLLVRKPSPRVVDAVLLPAGQAYPLLNGGDATSVRMKSMTVLQPLHQTYVSVTCDRLGQSVLQPHDELHQKNELLTMNRTAEIQPGMHYRTLIAN